jgi:hypothetical protein
MDTEVSDSLIREKQTKGTDTIQEFVLTRQWTVTNGRCLGWVTYSYRQDWEHMVSSTEFSIDIFPDLSVRVIWVFTILRFSRNSSSGSMRSQEKTSYKQAAIKMEAGISIEWNDGEFIQDYALWYPE